MFTGRYDHTIDRKGRVAIPAKFREVIAREYDNEPLSITNLEKCLLLVPQREWARTQERASQIPLSNAEAQDWLRFFVSGAVECPIDRQGRILIPPTLREHAGLDRQVIFAAMLTRFEIWDKSRFQQELKKTGSNFSSMAGAVEKYGV
jgi:MraZ protein